MPSGKVGGCRYGPANGSHSAAVAAGLAATPLGAVLGGWWGAERGVASVLLAGAAVFALFCLAMTAVVRAGRL